MRLSSVGGRGGGGRGDGGGGERVAPASSPCSSEVRGGACAGAGARAAERGAGAGAVVVTWNWSTASTPAVGAAAALPLGCSRKKAMTSRANCASKVVESTSASRPVMLHRLTPEPARHWPKLSTSVSLPAVKMPWRSSSAGVPRTGAPQPLCCAHSVALASAPGTGAPSKLPPT
jgi:hypothetical protein